MQIERKPSRWPYVGALIGLLIFCLTIPQYWRSTSERAAASDSSRVNTSVQNEIADADFSGHPYQYSWMTSGPSVPPSLLPQFGIDRAHLSWDAIATTGWQSHAINEILDILNTRNAYRASDDELDIPYGLSPDPSFTSYTDVSTWWSADGATADSAFTPTTLPEPLVALILERFGKSFVDRPSSLVDWLPRITKLIQVWSVVESFVHIEPITPDSDDSFPQLQLTDPADAVVHDNLWATPNKLVLQLTQLMQHPYSARWAEQTLSMVTALTRGAPPNDELMNALLRRLATSAEEAVRLADDSRDELLRAELLRAHWSLARRLDCWAVLHDIHVAAIEKRRVATRGSLDTIFAGPPLAEEIPSSVRMLNADLERYEESRDPAIARTIADSRHRLEKSTDDRERLLAGAVEQHYRNANLRLAVTAEMLNRFVGQQRSEDAPVRERIAGTPVCGYSHTLSNSRVKPQPATGRWHMELEADGHVDSNTRTGGSSAQLYSQSETDFMARKTIVVAPEGISTEPTVVSAYNRNRLVGVTTDFDWAPLLGSYARSMAMNQYRAKRSQAKSEVEYKVAARAMEQLDRETLDRVDRLEQDIRDRLVEPLERSGIDVTAVELTSTTDRVVARLRVAGDYQLAGHTPRPRALSDSLASAQLHETALTNAAVALGLDGQRLRAPELQAKLRQSLPNLVSENPRETRDDTVVHFAYQDAVQVRIADGKMELAITVDDFEQGGRRIRGFIVHAFYVPVVSGLEVELTREGPLGFEGRLSSIDRARLHNVFKEVLSKERRLPILKLDNPDDPRMVGLMITQLVLEDGWLGLSIGPETSGRVAERSRSLR